jgi:phosphatidylglycerol:prolipoprotein diacylglycerol transferase
MLPTLFHFELFGLVLRIHGYGFAIFCGAVAALVVAMRLRREAGLPARPLLVVFAVAILSGFAGAKAAFALQCGGSPLRGGLVFYGGLVVGLLAGLAASRWQRLPALRVADLAMPCVFLAAAFGRLGCLLAGCCYGSLWEGGLAYPAGSLPYRDQLQAGLIPLGAAHSLPTLPMPLFEAVALLVLFGAVSLHRRRAPGGTLARCLLLYPAWRFVAEFGRGDNHAWLCVFTFSQVVSVVLMAAGAMLLCARTEARSLPLAESFRWCTAWPAAASLVVVVAFVGGISCRTAPPPQFMAGEVEKPKRDKEQKPHHEHSRDVVDDIAESCLSGCMDACMESCAEALCEAACESEPDNTRPPERLVRALPRGRECTAGLDLRATVNDVLEVRLAVSGSFTVIEAGDDAAMLRGELSACDVTVGDFHVAGTGTVDVKIDNAYRLTLVHSTLPAGLLSALKSLEPFSGVLLSVGAVADPSPELVSLLEKELSKPTFTATGSGECVFDGHRRSLRAGLGWSDSGDRLRIRWWVADQDAVPPPP